MEKFISIATYTNEVEAELAQATLAAAGIESYLKYEDTGGMMPVLQQSEGIDILVDEEHAIEGKAVLTDQAKEEPDL